MRKHLCFCLLLMLLLLSLPARAQIETDYFGGDPYNYVTVAPRGNDASYDCVFVYLYGEGHEGNGLGDLSVLVSDPGAIAYARAGTLRLGEDVIVIAPQSDGKYDFAYEGDELLSFCAEMKYQYGAKTLILGGHSAGAQGVYAVSKIANKVVDGYVFLSLPVKSEDTSVIITRSPVFVSYGGEEGSDPYSDYADVVCSFLFRVLDGVIGEPTGNPLNVYQPSALSHGTMPAVLRQTAFRAWVKSVRQAVEGE